MGTSVAVIDYGMGNLQSVASAFSHISPDTQVYITADPQVIVCADKILFPGVGAIRDCMLEIHRLGLDILLPQLINDGKPVLAICLGMQALMTHSEENEGVDCLNVLSGTVNHFGDDLIDLAGHRLKVPHMGWNQVQQTSKHPLWKGIPDNSYFYFVHSYFVNAKNQEQVAGVSCYCEAFAAAMEKNTLFVTQFHPEKSDQLGLQFLKNFVMWNPN